MTVMYIIQHACVQLTFIQIEASSSGTSAYLCHTLYVSDIVSL